MARKKKNSAMPSSPSIIGASNRISADICDAENGFIVNVSGESGGKKPTYFSKRFIASSRPAARQIAASALSGGMKGKSSKKKAKRVMAKTA